MDPFSIPPHFHAPGSPEGQVLETSIIPDGLVLPSLPATAPEGARAIVDDGSGIIIFYRMVKGNWELLGAPKDAKYILQEANDNLPNAQDLSALDDGLLKVTDGVIETADPDTDYIATLPHFLIPYGATNFESLSRFTLGGNAPTVAAQGLYLLTTVSGSSTSTLNWIIASDNNGKPDFWTPLPWIAFNFAATADNAGGALDMDNILRIRLQDEGDSFTSDTVRHMGLKITCDRNHGANPVVLLSVADGTTQSTLDISSSLPTKLQTVKWVLIRYVSSSKVEVWVNGTLIGSITTHIPTYANAGSGAGINFDSRQVAGGVGNKAAWFISGATYGFQQSIT